MKTSEIRALSDADVVKELEGARKELFNLRFRLATKQLVNYRELPRTKRKIAQLLTIQTERKLQA